MNVQYSLAIVPAVFLGGSIGSYLSSRKLRLNWIRFLTATLVSYVGLRLILLHGFDISI